MKNSALVKVTSLKRILESPSVAEQFKNSLKENSGAFASSLIELYSGDNYLQNCEPKAVVMEALKAASLKLPINKNLGFAWIIPRKNHGRLEPNFEIGYKGYIQLAMRTGQYLTINADGVPDNFIVKKDWLAGTYQFIEPVDETPSDTMQGYFAYFKLANGFEKTVYWKIDKIKEHAKRYSQSIGSKYSPWTTQFGSMAKKTLLSYLLRTYGIMSTEMMNVIAQEKPETYEDELNEGDEIPQKQEIISGEVVGEKPEVKQPDDKKDDSYVESLFDLEE